MAIIPGHGLLFKGFFADGSECLYARTFIVIENTSSIIKALNVSSLKGKEHKLAFPSNTNLSKYKPPFSYQSFAKLDELYEIEAFPEFERTVLARGATIDDTELSSVIQAFSNYNETGAAFTVKFSKSALVERNPSLTATGTQ